MRLFLRLRGLEILLRSIISTIPPSSAAQVVVDGFDILAIVRSFAMMAVQEKTTTARNGFAPRPALL